MARARKTPGIAAVLTLLVALAGCGSGGSDTVQAGSTTTTTPAGFAAADTPLRDGFVVPEGTRLVGKVFSNSLGETYDSPGWSALLEIDSSPFEAWDALARQARAAGYRFSGSGTACSWWPDGDRPDVGVPRTRTGPGSEPPAPTIDAPTTAPRALFCDGTSMARVPTNGVAKGASTTFSATLRWGHGDGGYGAAPAATSAAAHLYITDQKSFDDSDDRASAGRSIGTFSDDPAPASVRRSLPKVTPAHPTVGQPMGTNNDCFEKGYDQLVVPRNAEVLGDAWAIEADFTLVVRVDDARAFFDDISKQLVGPSGQAVDSHPQIATVKATDGSSVLTFSNSVDGGGGGCGGQTSADGRYVIFHSYSD